jgi:hypothetical protein
MAHLLGCRVEQVAIDGAGVLLALLRQADVAVAAAAANLTAADRGQARRIVKRMATALGANSARRPGQPS